jgi:hypothetical protein
MTASSPAASGRPTLRVELDALHDDYAEAINHANAAGRDDHVAELAAAYDDEATRLVAEREGKTHLLPLARGAKAARPRRRPWRRRSSGSSAA